MTMASERPSLTDEQLRERIIFLKMERMHLDNTPEELSSLYELLAIRVDIKSAQDDISDFYKIIAALRAECAKLEAGWRPIETAPHGEEVLLYCPGRHETNQERIELGCASQGWRTAVASNISHHGWATHWMPLPKGPK